MCIFKRKKKGRTEQIHELVYEGLLYRTLKTPLNFLFHYTQKYSHEARIFKRDDGGFNQLELNNSIENYIIVFNSENCKDNFLFAVDEFISICYWLKKENYLHINNYDEVENYIVEFEISGLDTYELPDPHMYRPPFEEFQYKIQNSELGEVSPTPLYNDFVARGYKTREEYHVTKSLYWGKVSAIAAVLIALVTALFNLVSIKIEHYPDLTLWEFITQPF